jgi:glycosyltransferase involved in cell wall biosynthesis
MIPYGADEVISADASLLTRYELNADQYSIIIARPEPENSFFEMVTAFSSKKRNHKLVVLGNFQPSSNPYHKRVMDAGSDEVIFPGAIYETAVVQALRYCCRLYIHGHRVGGTNPSLVEALGAGCAVLAHDNPFNRWVTGPDTAFFKDETECSAMLDTLLTDSSSVESMRNSSRTQFKNKFTWQHILSEYESLLDDWNSKL